VAKGYKHSTFDGESMLKKLATLHIKYDLEYHYFNDRREMARFIEETFSAVERNWKSATKSVRHKKVVVDGVSEIASQSTGEGVSLSPTPLSNDETV
jgi:hypothetical protein